VQVASLREFVIAASLIAIMQLKPEGVFQSTNQKASVDPALRHEVGGAPAKPEAEAIIVVSHA
jgi:branched-chain amino acid transport system permease protein